MWWWFSFYQVSWQTTVYHGAKETWLMNIDDWNWRLEYVWQMIKLKEKTWHCVSWLLTWGKARVFEKIMLNFDCCNKKISYPFAVTSTAIVPIYPKHLPNNYHNSSSSSKVSWTWFLHLTSLSHDHKATEQHWKISQADCTSLWTSTKGRSSTLLNFFFNSARGRAISWKPHFATNHSRSCICLCNSIFNSSDRRVCIAKSSVHDAEGFEIFKVVSWAGGNKHRILISEENWVTCCDSRFSCTLSLYHQKTLWIVI